MYASHFEPAETVNAVTTSEHPVESYANRNGYDRNFLEKRLDLPGPAGWTEDLVPLTDGSGTELRYTNFSIQMSASRALPLFSACNIDGSLSDRTIGRTDLWRRDPRVSAAVQDLRTPYGREPDGLFSRGHMTRREDPNWGPEAKTADADTFHITNVAPQRQGFNGGIWLDLENYVLDNTDDEDMRVTVITGPVLEEDDPMYFQTRVPVEFWKVLAFVHVKTKLVTTIAYKRSQLAFLPSRRNKKRFVFGDFEDTQVSISSLAEQTGLNFDDYIQHDVMKGADSSLEIRLNAVSDAYLRR